MMLDKVHCSVAASSAFQEAGLLKPLADEVNSPAAASDVNGEVRLVLMRGMTVAGRAALR